MIAAAMLTVEMLRFTPQSQRSHALFDAMATAAGADVRVIPTTQYQGEADWLMVWGPGAASRFAPMRRQVETGRHAIAFDLAYWDRHRKVRVAIDAAHPQAWVMRREWPVSRLKADAVPIADYWEPKGPVLVAGVGDKARAQYGDVVSQWEAQQIAHATRAGRRVWYRPKKDGSLPRGVERAAGGEIDTVLRGISLVATWHSNVAVDAIRMGIPAICRDGAAAAVCAATWTDETRPLEPDVRRRFLANLAWFQWRPDESAACWAWLKDLLR